MLFTDQDILHEFEQNQNKMQNDSGVKSKDISIPMLFTDQDISHVFEQNQNKGVFFL
jgi:hypothetical protein